MSSDEFPLLCVTSVPSTCPAASSCTLTSVVPLVPEARAAGAMSGGWGVAITAAAALGFEQPELGDALAVGVAAATAGAGRGVPEPPPGPGAFPKGSALPRGRGIDGFGVAGGGGGGTLAAAIVVGRRSIETTSA